MIGVIAVTVAVLGVIIGAMAAARTRRQRILNRSMRDYVRRSY